MTMIRPDLSTDVAAILAGTLNRFAQHATVIVDEVPVDVVAGQSAAVKAAGWEHARIGPWTVYRRQDRTVAMGLRASMHPRDHFGVLVHRDTEPGTLALLLDRYNGLIGNAWRGTPATTALNLIRLSWPNTRYQPLWTHRADMRVSHVGPLMWSRELGTFERDWGWLHTFDVSGAYLGAAAMAEVAWSGLDTTGVQPFDAKLPGYWLLSLDPASYAEFTAAGRPPLFGPRAVRDHTVWVTTPYAKLCQDIGLRLDVIDSLTASAMTRADGSLIHPAGARVFRTWAAAMKQARAQAAAMPTGALRDVLLGAVKRTYTDATGGMQRDGMRIHRPDWAHTIIDLGRANLYRLMMRVHETEGIWPVQVRTDSVTYADCTPDPGGLLTAVQRATRATINPPRTITIGQWLDGRQRATEGVRRGPR